MPLEREFEAMTQFSRIGIVGRPDHEGVVDTARRLLKFLREKKRQVIMDDVTAKPGARWQSQFAVDTLRSIQ